MKACVLVKTEPGKYTAVSGKLRRVRGVKRCFPVWGRADVVAVLNVRDLKELSRTCLRIGRTAGVVASETLIAVEV